MLKTGFLLKSSFLLFIQYFEEVSTNESNGLRYDYFSSAIAACAAASLATGTLYGEQETYVNPTL